jgi:hypothetical protein
MDDSELRTLLDRVKSQATEVATHATTDEVRARCADLEATVSALVKHIGLGPVPDRKCPSCGNHGMRNATLCGYCWMKLSPLPA